jgi:hypothetical protein
VSEVQRPDRHALLELDALLEQIAVRLDAGNRERYDSDDDYRWVIHRLWIAVGNEALAYTQASNLHPLRAQPWGMLYRLRNIIAHDRLTFDVARRGHVMDQPLWRHEAQVAGKRGLTWGWCCGAGDENRTRTTSLEGWGSTIELHPQRRVRRRGRQSHDAMTGERRRAAIGAVSWWVVH